ncbi:dihydroflavonol-4-reductase [Cordyceps fumosorosea ARSEF 2679]|uniref:Dihydroflavonol-4-reductase n=1 Tax=Cordyceps fumosorosea (strain ARSEF 2679) TaxID=1081104 RepID=A0A167TJ00_CORFA|nr:dihydroflavonol-4-reductase [Cordyceps fumosorosea ARSEF 2679]OAA60646.1 dihydroflavonol-4-reductase [Cordyceps fumosorosea ARSEF 2679]
MADGKLALVTGGSGFIALHVIHKLLEKGYRVRTTVRSLKRSDEVRSAIRRAGVAESTVAGIEFVEVDLLGEAGWDAACTAPVTYGHAPRDAAFTEADWTELQHPHSSVGAYAKSKTIAERAAWDWAADEGAGMELTTVNPALVCGPALGVGNNTSLEIPRRLLSGAMPAIPDMSFGIVDVRDVADLHVLALEAPGAAGQRYIAVSDEPYVTIKQMAADLKSRLPAADTRRVPSLPAPKFLLRVAALFDKGIAVVLPEIGQVRPVSNKKARDELGWRPRSAADALVASAESLKANGEL